MVKCLLTCQCFQIRFQSQVKTSYMRSSPCKSYQSKWLNLMKTRSSQRSSNLCIQFLTQRRLRTICQNWTNLWPTPNISFRTTDHMVQRAIGMVMSATCLVQEQEEPNRWQTKSHNFRGLTWPLCKTKTQSTSKLLQLQNPRHLVSKSKSTR